MIVLTHLALGFLGFVVCMLGMIAWIDRDEGPRDEETPHINPSKSEARAQQSASSLG